MPITLVKDTDTLERQNEKLLTIADALMRRVEQSPDQAGIAYAQFERAALLENEVRQRTTDLERTLDLLHDSNARLAAAREEAETARANMSEAIETVAEGFALFDTREELVMFNSRFCKDLPDVRDALHEGLRFERYVELLSQSVYRDWTDRDTPENWRATRMELHHRDHVVFNTSLTDNRWLQVSEHRTGSGGTVILQTDVTRIMRLERRERDRLVHRQARMLRATLDHLNQGVCIFDRDSRLVGWNQQMEQLLHRPIAGSVLGLDFGDLLDRLDRTFVFSGSVSRSELRAWADKGTGRAPLNFEVNGEQDRIYAVFAQQMPDRGFVISFTDISDERHTAAALRELNETLERRVTDRTAELGDALADARRANSTKTRFVAAASHDLLQPMSAAKLYAAALEDGAPDDHSRALAQKTISALDSAEGIIEALLDISKLDSGLATFEIEPVNLSAIFTALATELGPLASAKGLELRVVPTTLRVKSDRVFLRRIIQNIVTNAIRYTTGKRILLGTRRVGGTARIEVWDQGPGIPEDKHEMIFQEFRQLEDGRQSGQGLGLGLAIVERACKMLEHDLGLWSQPGLGSCFSVCAEVSEAITPGITVEAPQTGKRFSTQGRIIGLVENDPDLASSITLTIENAGSEVIWAESGEAMLDLLDDLGIVPDGFLLDYQLGEGMDGLAVLEQLQQKYGSVVADVISANRSPQLLSLCWSRGVSLRPKPLSRNDLLAFVASVPLPLTGNTH